MIKKATPSNKPTANKKSALRLTPECAENAALFFESLIEDISPFNALEARALQKTHDGMIEGLKTVAERNGVSISDETAKSLVQRVNFAAVPHGSDGKVAALRADGKLSGSNMFSFVGEPSATNLMFICALVAIGDAISAERVADKTVEVIRK